MQSGLRPRRAVSFYERSALQAADICTKAFSVPAEWDRAARLINVLDPARFWDGAKPGDASHCMPSVHKGEVEFAYSTSNPWHGRGPRNIPRPTAEVEAHAATPARPYTPVDNHVPWVTPPCSHAAKVAPATRKKDPDDEDYFQEAPEYDDDDYASTQDPGSDADLLTDSEDEAAAPEATRPAVAAPARAATHTPTHTTSVTTLPTTLPYARRIVEFCCGPHSRSGNRAPTDCDVVRLTIDDDLTTQAGLEQNISAVSQANIPTLLFGALPCTYDYTRHTNHGRPSS